MNAIGYVVVGSDPVVAASDWLVDNQHRAPVRRFHYAIHRLPLPHGGHDLGTVFFRIDVEAACCDPVVDQVHQRAAGFHDVGRQTVHLDIAVVADHDTFVVVEHNDALRHIVESHGQQSTVAAAATASASTRDHECPDNRHNSDDGIHLQILIKEIVQGSPTHPIREVIRLQVFNNC